MASNRLMGMFIICFILMFTYPAFNDQMITIGEHENATDLDVTLMNYFPSLWMILLFAILGFTIYEAVGTIR